MVSNGFSYWFIFYENEILVHITDNQFIVPLCESSGLDESDISFVYSPGHINDSPYFAVSLKNKVDIPEMNYIPLRALLGRLDDELFNAAGRSYQILYWNANHAFCGRCGSESSVKKDELAKVCIKCGLTVYPRISPAVIVAVTKDDKLLLARAGRFRNKMFSVLAGFVEPGETFEQCIEREIYEEVNIKVHNMKYFGSQPWPFPDSIMVGFTAEYKSGELRPDGTEILEADWFSKEQIPEIPGKWSIARKLIDWFLTR